MRITFCPECGSIVSREQKSCPSCKYSGRMKEGSAEELNEYRKKVKKSTIKDYIKKIEHAPQIMFDRKAPKESLKERLKKKTSENSEWEIV